MRCLICGCLALTGTRVSAIVLHPFIRDSTGYVCPPYSQNDDGTQVRSVIFNHCNSHAQGEPINFRSIPEIRSSGSGQHCLGAELKWLEQWAFNHRPMVVVDLRMEPHGFIDDQAISLFCPKGWDLLHIEDFDQLMAIERLDIGNLSLHPKYRIHNKIIGSEGIDKGTIIAYSQAQSEEEVMQALGIPYYRVPVPDHRRPRDREVDLLVRLFKESPTQWLHFHCKAGLGRTTTAIIMRDIFENAPRLSFDQIMRRNARWNPIDLSKTHYLKGNFKYEYAVERLAFLQAFHVYCSFQNQNQNQKNSSSWPSWSAWIKDKMDLVHDLQFAPTTILSIPHLLYPEQYLLDT